MRQCRARGYRLGKALDKIRPLLSSTWATVSSRNNSVVLLCGTEKRRLCVPAAETLDKYEATAAPSPMPMSFMDFTVMLFNAKFVWAILVRFRVHYRYR
jgi:hypothetical protein